MVVVGGGVVGLLIVDGVLLIMCDSFGHPPYNSLQEVGR